MDFKRVLLDGQRFKVNGAEFICLETHAYFQTRIDGEQSDIDVGSSYYIVRNTYTGGLHKIPFQRVLDKHAAGEITYKR